jgi:hypothetical protein
MIFREFQMYQVEISIMDSLYACSVLHLFYIISLHVFLYGLIMALL